MKKLLLIFIFSLLIANLSFSQNITLRSNLAYPFDLSNLWGYADSLGNEYALVGTYQGFSVVNVTDPDNIFEVDTMKGTPSTWREVRTWKNYAYVTTEGGNGVADGLTIVDLSYLPDSVVYKRWRGNGAINGMLSAIHALHIEDGYAYLYGSSIAGKDGALIVDLADPWNPNYISHYSSMGYVHDGQVRNDTLYAGHILDGYFSVVDVSDKTNPVALQTQNTPNNFTHNTWLTDDSRTLLATDEVDNSFLTSYDVTDITDIKELDRIQSTPGSLAVVHNTYVLNDYAVTSWYKEGVVIVDAHRPENLAIVGRYDTSPLSGGGTNGNWGVYPFLPSGNIIASDMEEGLFVLTPTYVRAAYLEGTVIDSLCNVPIQNVKVSISGTIYNEKTDLNGKYKGGVMAPGTYDVTFSSPGYTSKTISGIILDSTVVVNLDVILSSDSAVSITGTVIDSTGAPVAGANVQISNATQNYTFVTDASGNFSHCNFIAGSNYTFTAGKWGYKTSCVSGQTVSSSSPFINLNIDKGYYDDFTFNFGWAVTGNATTGFWERGKPVGTFNGATPSNPGIDVNSDCGTNAYVTGNGGGNAGDDDIDNGNTVLTSHVFDLSTYGNPSISYSRWFYNAGGSGSPNDSLIVKISNGITEAVLEKVTAATTGNSTWLNKTFRVKDFIFPTANMRISFNAMDVTSGHLVEAGVDKFEVTNSMTDTIIIDTAIIINTNCPSCCDGSVNIMASGGFPPYIYTWTNTVSTSDSVDSLCAGEYIVCVSDSTGNQNCDTIFIGTENNIMFDSVIVSDASCATCCDGSVELYISGGFPPYSYTWTNSVSTSENADSLCAGEYFVCVSDSTGNQKCDTVFISAPSGINDLGKRLNCSVFPNPFTSKITLNYSFNSLQNASYAITDITGRTMETGLIINKEGALQTGSNLSSGVYFVKFVNGGEVAVLKVVKL